MNLRGMSKFLWLLLLVWITPLWSQVPVGTVIDNVARFAYHTSGGVPGLANSDTTVTIVSAGYKVNIFKSSEATVVTPGDSLNYHISVNNSGNIPTENLIVSDTLDPQLTYASGTPPATVDGQVLTWSMPEIAPGETRVIDLLVELQATTRSGEAILNHAFVQVGDDDPIISESVQIVTGDLVDLMLTKTVDRLIAEPGDTLTYSLEVTNTGNTISSQTYLRDDLPDNLVVVSISGNGTLNGDIITWNIGDLEPGSTLVETVQAIIPDLIPINSRIINNGSVTNSSEVTRTSIVETLANPWEISFTKSALPGPYEIGDSIAYLLHIDNDSDSDIYDVVVVDTLPHPLEFVSSDPPTQVNGNIVTWFLGSMAPASTHDLQIMAEVGNTDEAISSLINRAHINTINGGSVQDTAAVELLLSPNLFLNKYTTSSIIPGDSLHYSLRFGNSGLLDATGVVLVDSLPAEVSFVTATGNYDYDASAHTLTWNLGVLARESLDSIRVSTQVATPLPDQISIVNTAWMLSNQANSDTAVVQTLTASVPEIDLQKSGPVVAVSGDTLDYSLNVINTGTAIATQTSLIDSLPPELAFVSADNDGIYHLASHTVEWSIGNLEPHIAIERSLKTRAIGGVTPGAQIINHARIQSSEIPSVVASHATTLRAPQLVVSVSSDSVNVIAASTFSFRIDFQNLGDTVATEVILVDSLPEHLEYISSEGGLYNAETHTVSWDLGDLDPESSSRASKFQRVSQAVVGSRTLEVRVVSPIANNTIMHNIVNISCAEDSRAQDQIDITAISGPFISLSKLAELEVFPGDTIHYVLNYENIGSDAANNVMVTDTLDQRLTFVNVDNPGVYNPGDHSLTWSLGSLASGSSGSLQFSARIATSLGDGEQVSNNAWVVSDETHPYQSIWATTNILPMTMTLSASPHVILGNGESTSTLTARVYSYLGNPAPDGIPVSFVSNKGFIPADRDTILLADGVATSSIVADTVVTEAVNALIEARASYSAEKYASDTTEVVFIIGAFVGNIYDIDGNPIQDVLVELIRISTGEVAGFDSTDSDGYYLIPVYHEEEYIIRYTWIDEDGNVNVYEQTIVIEVPNNGTISTNLNSISGWIYNELTGAPIIEEGIQVILSRDSTVVLSKSAVAVSSDTTYTDSTGRYFFTNLDIGVYDLSVLYRGVQSFSDGAIQVNLVQPGVFVTNANISLRQSPYYIYKTVEQVEAMIGDTLDYRLTYGAHQSVTDSVTIIDFLPQGLHLVQSSIISDGQTSLASYDPISNEVQFVRNNVPLDTDFTIDLKAIIQRDISSTMIENRATIASEIDTSYSERDTRTQATTKLIFPFLKVTKTVNRRVAEPGDFLTYTVVLSNVSTDESVDGIEFNDLIPTGFKFRRGTTYLEGNKLSNPKIIQAGSQQQLGWTLPDTLHPGESLTLKYRLICGINSPMGYAVNEVYALAQTLDGFSLASNLAQATVEVKPGILSDRGIILGKAFYDENDNGIQDRGELTQSDVELILENGTRVKTDKDGKYSIPNVAAGIHILRVNESSLPENVSVRANSFRNLKNGQSQLIQMGGGAMIKANIPLARTEIKSGIANGLVYFDLDGNGIYDNSDSVFAGAHFTLDDSLNFSSDSSGKFRVSDIRPGEHKLSMQPSQLPPYVEYATSSMDSITFEGPDWVFTTVGEDTLNFAMGLNLKTMEIALANHATLKMNTKMLTQEFRLLVYQPWSMLLRIDFGSGQAELTMDAIPELRRVGELLLWQPQLNLDINGHTDNVPLAAGGRFADNMELSLARAQSIEQFLVNEMGLAPERFKASGFGDTLPIISGDTPEVRALNRRVEMVFYNAQAQDSKYSKLDFQFQIDYSGEIRLDSIAFNQILPPGFAYMKNSGKLQDVPTEPELDSDTLVTWNFGGWDQRQDEVFDFAMVPDDFEEIANISIVTTYLEYTDLTGERVITDSLETRLSTLVEELSFNMVLKGTQFDVGSADLKSSAFGGLQKLGEFMTWQEGINIVVEGFTDNRGGIEFNMALSEMRAESVKNYLLNNFNINPDRIQVHGLGPHYPVATNETWAGRATNRRVEVLVNAVVGEAAIMEIEILKEALIQELSYPVDPFSEEWQDSTLTVNKGQVTSFWVNMNDPVPMDYDQVKLTMDLPDGILSERNGTSKIVMLSDLDENQQIHELVLLRSNDGLPEGKYEIGVIIQRLKDGEPVGPVEERIVELKFR